MSPILLPVKKRTFIERTEFKPLIGGPDSGIPPLFEVGSGLHSHAVLGIDIGNESARMATLRHGRIMMVGGIAPSVMEEKVQRRVPFDKVHLRSEGDVGFARAIKSKIGSDWNFTTAGETYSAELLYSLLIESLKDTAQEQLEELVSKCVITVPLGFTAAQRSLVKQAAEDAGLEVLQLLNETSASALEFCVQNPREQGKYCIVSAGAGSFGVMVFEYYRGILEVKAASGDSCFGADDFDNAIVELMIKRAEEQNSIKLRLDTVLLERMRREASEVRLEVLRSQWHKRIYIPNLPCADEGFRTLNNHSFELDTVISSNDYLECTKTLSEKLQMHVDEAMAASGFAADEIDMVLMHGGFAVHSLVQEAITQVFGKSVERRFLDLHTSAAFGAAIQANLITYGLHNMVVWDVLTSPIGIEREDGSFKEIVARNTPLPVRAFHQVPVLGATALAHFVQGDSHRASENASLAEVTANNCPPAREGTLAVEIGVVVSGDGMVDFTARHCELMSNLPISVREGERRTFVSHIEDLRQMRTLTKEASTERTARLARKLNQPAEMIPKTLRDLGYSPASIKSGYAVEHLLLKMSNKRARRRVLAEPPISQVS